MKIISRLVLLAMAGILGACSPRPYPSETGIVVYRLTGAVTGEETLTTAQSGATETVAGVDCVLNSGNFGSHCMAGALLLRSTMQLGGKVAVSARLDVPVDMSLFEPPNNQPEFDVTPMMRQQIGMMRDAEQLTSRRD